MLKAKETVQNYWNERSEIFGNYYKKPTLFDSIMRKGIYSRVAVSVQVCKSLTNPTVLDVGSGPGINSETIIKNTSI